MPPAPSALRGIAFHNKCGTRARDPKAAIWQNPAYRLGTPLAMMVAEAAAADRRTDPPGTGATQRRADRPRAAPEAVADRGMLVRQRIVAMVYGGGAGWVIVVWFGELATKKSTPPRFSGMLLKVYT